MKVLVVSDTHGRDESLEMAVALEQPFDYLIHCGDVEGREFFIEALAECPCTIVAGNNDFFSRLPREDEFYIGNKKAFITHGHNYSVSMTKEQILEEGKVRGADIVMFGHTHQPYFEQKDGITLLNPGSLSYPRQIGRKGSYMLLDVKPNGEMNFEERYLDI
jgi:putative phosphoesterase